MYLEPDELGRLVRTAASGQRGVPDGGRRDVALVLVMALAGLRVAEACALDRGDIDQGWLWVWHGKGDKERRVPLSGQTREALLDYLSHRHDDDPAMFLSREGGRLSTRAAREVVTRLSRRAGISKQRAGRPVNVSPHKLRHTAGTMLAKGGVTTKNIMDILGHQSEATAHIYIAEVAGPDDMAALERVVGRLLGPVQHDDD